VAALNYARIQEYLTTLVPRRDPEMLRMERSAKRSGFPIIGPVAGHYCYQLARLMRARSVFELGSGYGYSTAWFARAVKENGGGVVHHTVWDAKLSGAAQVHLSRMGFDGTVRYHVAEAVHALAEEAGGFDLIFCDIDKDAYPAALAIIKAKLRRGGAMIIDNMLWSGRIFDSRVRDRDTRGVRQFTRAITSDPDWIVSLVPIRDGMIVGWLRSD